MQNLYTIILAGGTGSRIGHSKPKQFLDISGKPLIIHTLERFNLPEITGIIIVMAKEFIDYTDKLVKDYSINKIIKIIHGGKTRQGSSYNAVNAINYQEDDILIFHDAARPFIKTEVIYNCINEAKFNEAAGVYLRSTDTIVHAENNFVSNILDREKIFYTQTPQVFKYKIIKEAHKLALTKGITDSTDDAQLVIDAGYNVKLVEGHQSNIKITKAFDLDMAEFIYRLNK